MGKHRKGGDALVSLIEALEARVLFSGVDPAITAYQSRASQVLSANISSIVAWAATHAGTDNLSTGSLSEWTAAAAFTDSGSNQSVVNDGYLLLGSLMEYRVSHLFAGGNDGWEAWATADTYLRYRSVIDADTVRYAPSGYATNPNSTDGKYSLDDLCKIVLTQSFYGPLDSTSNHVLMNATACYLANQAFPGQVVQDYNKETSDPTGANTLLGRAENLFAGGPAEYGSINYGGYDWQEFLSVFQLTQSGNATLADASRQAFETALAMNVAYWMNGQLAMPTGRGYPTTGAWGASEGDTLDYVYVGGNYGQSQQQITYADATDVKATAVLAAEAQNINSYIPPVGILHLADSTPHITESNYGGNHQYAYDTEQWSTYSESWKYDAHGPYQSSWRARTIWTKPQDQTYQATAWVTEPSTNTTANSDGSYNYVNPYTLQAYATSGSGSYQDSPFEDVSQYQNTQLHVYNIPPVSLEGTPGGQLPVRGAMVYLPIPVVTSTGQQAANGNEWMAPVLSADGHYLFVGYNNCFMAFISSAPFSVGTTVGNSQFYNVFGGPVAGQQVNPSQFIQCAVAQEVFSASNFAGTTLAEQFTNFENTLMSRQIPKMTVADTFHPTWQYSNGQNTLTNEYVGETHDNPDSNPGLGQDYVGGPGNSNPQVVDYAKWPMLYESDLSGNVWANMPQNGNLTVTAPGQTAVDYDFADYVTSTGSNIGLTVVSNTGGQISLGWNGGLDASSFTIARSTDDVHWTTLTSNLAAGATSYTDTGLTQGQNYDYIVTPNGTSIGASEPVGTAAIFNTPTNFKLTATTATSATVSWTNNSAGNIGLQLQYSIDGYPNQWRYWAKLSATSTSTTATLTNTSSFLDTAPTPQNPTDPNNRVFFRVVAYSTTANGTDIYSQPTSIVGSEFSSTFAGDLVSMPYGLAATSISPTQVAISWTNTATTLSAYRVERSTNDTNWTVLTASLAPTATTYTDQTVQANQTYYYRVAAVNGTTLSPYSQVINVVAANPNQALTSVTLSKSSIESGGTVQAAAYDQFGNALSPAPTWSATGGTITTAGLYTAGSTGGSYTITATSGTYQASAGVTVVPTTYTGSTGNDTYAIRLSPSSPAIEQIFVNTPETSTPTYTVAISNLSSLTFTTANDGSLTVDFTNGNPLPSAGINYSGGSVLSITGAAAGGMAFTINSAQVLDTAAASSPMTYSSLASVVFNLSGGGNTLTQLSQPAAAVTYNAGSLSNTLNISGGTFNIAADPQISSGNLTVNDNANLTFSAPASGSGYNARNLYALNLGTGATAKLLAASTTSSDRTVLVTGSLSISTGATLDLTNNAMIVHNGIISTLTALIAKGFNAGSGYWNGTGITSSNARGDTTELTAIGVISNNYSGTAIYSNTFDNQSVSLNDVLVKYTYVGDANLDGAVNGSDYTKIDNGFHNNLTGWLNGDFNYDGVVNGSDYTLIDNAFNMQSASLAAQISSPAARLSTRIAVQAAPQNVIAVGSKARLGRDVSSIKDIAGSLKPSFAQNIFNTKSVIGFSDWTQQSIETRMQKKDLLDDLMPLYPPSNS